MLCLNNLVLLPINKKYIDTRNRFTCSSILGHSLQIQTPNPER
jgi:hypothetical protein